MILPFSLLNRNSCFYFSTLRKDFVILQLYCWLFSSTQYCSWNMVKCVVILQSYFPSYNYQQDKRTYYDCWITLQSALKIAASNMYCKITLVWLDTSLSAVNAHIRYQNKGWYCCLKMFVSSLNVTKQNVTVCSFADENCPYMFMQC